MPVPGYRPQYASTSPWKFSQIVGNYLTYYVHRPVNPQSTDRTFTVRDERYVHRPDLLAHDIYGDADLWWVIPVRNRFEDPVFDMKMGTTIFIPDERYVRSIL